MMHVQPGISRLPLAMLAGVAIAIEHIGTDVVKVALRTVLILNACNLGILQTLDIKLGFLEDDGGHRQNLQYLPDTGMVRCDLVLKRWSQPALVPASHTIAEAGSAISRLAAAPCTAQYTTIRIEPGYVLPFLNFRRVQLSLLRGSRQSDGFGSRVDTKRNGLSVFASGNLELNGEGRLTRDKGFPVLEEMASLGALAGHERLTPHVQNKNSHGLRHAQTPKERIAPKVAKEKEYGWTLKSSTGSQHAPRSVPKDPSPMLDGVCCPQHRSLPSELLITDRRARDLPSELLITDRRARDQDQHLAVPVYSLPT